MDPTGWMTTDLLPSTTRVAPFMYVARSGTKKSTVSAMSSMVPS